VWHFCLTVIGIGLFSLGFYFILTRSVHPGESHGAGLAMALAWLASFPLVAVAQGIFIVNLISGLMKLSAHT